MAKKRKTKNVIYVLILVIIFSFSFIYAQGSNTNTDISCKLNTDSKTQEKGICKGNDELIFENYKYILSSRKNFCLHKMCMKVDFINNKCVYTSLKTGDSDPGFCNKPNICNEQQKCVRCIDFNLGCKDCEKCYSSKNICISDSNKNYNACLVNNKYNGYCLNGNCKKECESLSCDDNDPCTLDFYVEPVGCINNRISCSNGCSECASLVILSNGNSNKNPVSSIDEYFYLTNDNGILKVSDNKIANPGNKGKTINNIQISQGVISDSYYSPEIKESGFNLASGESKKIEVKLKYQGQDYFFPDSSKSSLRINYNNKYKEVLFDINMKKKSMTVLTSNSRESNAEQIKIQGKVGDKKLINYNIINDKNTDINLEIKTESSIAIKNNQPIIIKKGNKQIIELEVPITGEGKKISQVNFKFKETGDEFKSILIINSELNKKTSLENAPSLNNFKTGNENCFEIPCNYCFNIGDN